MIASQYAHYKTSPHTFFHIFVFVLRRHLQYIYKHTHTHTRKEKRKKNQQQLVSARAQQLCVQSYDKINMAHNYLSRNV